MMFDNDNQDRLLSNGYGIFGLWLNWAMSAGSVIVALLLTQVISKFLYPILCLGICLLLYVGVRNNRNSQRPVCYLLPFLMSRVFFISAIIMMVINLLHRKHYVDLIFADVELLNPDIPYIAILVIAPVTLVMSLWIIWRKHHLPFCAECIRRYGTTAERGFLGEFYTREGRFLLKMMMWLSLGITVVDYVYYFVFYININLNRPDIYFFVVAPSLLLGFSIIFVGIRYIGVWQYYRQNLYHAGVSGQTTQIRFLVIHKEEMLLKIPELDPDKDIDDPRADTPVTLTLNRKERVTLDGAREYFRKLTNIKEPVDMRLLYANTYENADSNIYHFLVNYPERTFPENARIEGDWFTLPMVSDLINNKLCKPILGAEMRRLVLIAKACKVYDYYGIRRYGIKDYEPPFRISDLANPDIDFVDTKWLYIADNNEDSPFFKLRRFWSRHISGVTHKSFKRSE